MPIPSSPYTDHPKVVNAILENQEKLNACPDHNFVVTWSVLVFRCENCGGETNVYARDWYEKGKAHAKQ